MLPVISIDVFAPVSVCPVQCIGVAARVAAPSLSAWEVCDAARG